MREALRIALKYVGREDMHEDDWAKIAAALSTKQEGDFSWRWREQLAGPEPIRQEGQTVVLVCRSRDHARALCASLAAKQEGLVAGAGRSAVIRASEHPSSPVSPTPEERGCDAEAVHSRALEAAAKVCDARSRHHERTKFGEPGHRGTWALWAVEADACANAIRALKHPADVAGEEQNK